MKIKDHVEYMNTNVEETKGRKNYGKRCIKDMRVKGQENWSV